MSQCLPKDTVIVCSENISNYYRLTTSEILSHAKKLGVDYLTERHLLPIVLEGLVHPLPPDWVPCFDKELRDFFYYHREHNISQWEHPIDEHYRNLLSKIRNEYNGNLNAFLRSKENLDMLPLRKRQNKKPELLPIQQLLNKVKDEERSAIDDKIFKSELHSSLKTRNDSSPACKKSVAFITGESISKKKNQFFNNESEKNLEKIQSNKNGFCPETVATFNKTDDFHNLVDHGQYSSDDNSKLVTPFSKDLNRKITSLKQSFNQTKSNSETHPSSKNFTREHVHINLQRPDSLLFSDSNRDDTIKNILSASPSLELVSEEEESPHNVLTNITESGIDVNTVTDLQKLKARNKLGNQSSNVDKEILRIVDVSSRSAIARLEQNLNDKFEEKISEEMIKLKKLYRDRMEPNVENSSRSFETQNDYKLFVNETHERFKVFKEEIEEEIKENLEVLKELQNKHDVEMNNLRENVNNCIKFCEIQHNYVENSDSFKKLLESSLKEKLNNIEQSLIKKAEKLETRLKTKLEEFSTEKEEFLAEYREKVQLFLNENSQNAVQFGQDNLKSAVQQGLNELFTKEMRSGDLVFQSIEKVVMYILNEKHASEKNEDICKKNIATQTENVLNLDEITTLKKNIKEISNGEKRLVKGTLFCRRFENKDILKKDSNEIFSIRNNENFDYPIDIQMPVKMESFKTDFSPFEEFSSHIDEELNRYRRKYLSNSKWSNFGISKNDV